jgi:hypothetical protein
VFDLLRVVQDRYGDKVKVTIKDPRNILAVWDNIRYRVQVKPPLPAWILDSKKICDGVPELADLERAIDEKLISPIA